MVYLAQLCFSPPPLHSISGLPDAGRGSYFRRALTHHPS